MCPEDPSMFDRLLQSKPEKEQWTVLKYKLECENLAKDPPHPKIYPQKFPKLDRSRVWEQDVPGVGTYRNKLKDKHSYQPIIMQSSTGSPVRQIVSSYLDYAPQPEKPTRVCTFQFGKQSRRKIMGHIGDQIDKILEARREKLRERMAFLGPDEKEKLDDSLNYKLVENFYHADVLNNRSDAIYNFKESIKREIMSKNT